MSPQASGELPNPLKKIRVVLADDHREVAAEVQAILGDEFDIVRVVEDGKQAVRAVLTMDPDVLVTDISMPLLNGLEVARTILQADCRAKVVFLTVHEGGHYIAAAFSAGGLGYVTKRDLTTDLVYAIRESLKGRTFVSNSIRI